MGRKKYYLGIFFVLLSAIGFSSLQMFVKLLPDISVMNKMFYRNIVISLITYGIIKYKGISLKVPKSEWTLLGLRSLFGNLGVAVNFYALSYILLADSTTIQKLSSFIMLIISWILFNEKFTKIHLATLLVSFLGVILIVKPGINNISIGHILALMGAFFSAFAYSCIRKLGIRSKINPILIVFYFSLSTCIITVMHAIFNLPDFNIRTISFLFFIGLFGAIGQFGITFAYKLAASKEISVFEYTQVIFSSILGIAFLNEYPDIYSLIGYALIVLMGIINYWYNKRNL